MDSIATPHSEEYPVALNLAPSGTGLFDQVAKEGGWLDAASVLDRLQLDIAGLASLYNNNAILGIVHHDMLWFPVLQFDERHVSPYILTLLTALPAPLTMMDRLTFLFTPIAITENIVMTPAAYRRHESSTPHGAQAMSTLLHRAALFTRNRLKPR